MIYFDNAATSFPKPWEVYDAVIDCMKNYAANPGRGSYDMSVRAALKVMEARELLCELFNIHDVFNMIFTENATAGLNIGIKGVLEKGDHAISTMIEHNSVLRPLNSLCNNGIKVTLVKVDQEGKLNIKDIEKAIKRNTKMIIVNHMSNVLGSVQDIEKIGEVARKNGILFMVDASQSAGRINIDVEKSHIDLLAFPGHKGLFGPQGTGGLFIREGIKLKNFKEGGTGSNSHFMAQPNFLPDQFESGTLNVSGIAGLCEGLKFIKKAGLDDILNHERKLSKYLVNELKKISHVKIYGDMSQENMGVISFNIENMDSASVGEKLNEKEIAVRTGYHCAPLIHKIIGTEDKGTVRVSLGYFNTFGEVEEFIEVIEDILS